MRIVVGVLILLLLAFLPGALQAAMMTEVPSLGPSGYGPGWLGYRSNAITGLRSAMNSVGNPALDPSGYEKLVADLSPDDILMTYSAGMKSWRGDLSPAGTFSGEYGNTLYFGLAVKGQVKLADVQCRVLSTDSPPTFSSTSSFASSSYSTSRVGVKSGADGQLGTSDDVVVTSGAGTQLVDAIYLVGVGVNLSPAARLTVDGKIPFDVSVTYGLGGLVGGDTVTSKVSLVLIPEPALVGPLLFAGVWLVRSRRRAS